MAKRDPSNKKRFVIVGGGPAALTAAETLRQSDFTGEIIVISAENVVPYDRTLLSKALPVGDASKWSLRSNEFLNNADIDVKLGQRAESVNTSDKFIKLTDGTKVVSFYTIFLLSSYVVL